MTDYNPENVESTDPDERDVRALSQYLTVLPEAPGVFEVVSESGRSYTVDAPQGVCSCPDFEYRDIQRCKHIARVEFETGRRPIPEWIETDDLPADFGRHVEADPNVGASVATDGGQDASVGACPFDDPICGGVSGLFFGELSCFECYRLAPQSARDIAHCWLEIERTGRQHPALAGEVVA